MTKPQRPSANATRQRILVVAKQLFLEKGFDGTSVHSISQLADVNKTLIFHHYKNKQTLWLKVKNDILKSDNESPKYNKTSASEYFKSIIDYRFKLYRHNPDLANLVRWQQVSDDERVLIGNDFASPGHWLTDIIEFQNKGEIDSSITPELIMLFIIYSGYAPFLQHVIPFSRKQETQYKNIILNACVQQFVVQQ